MEPWRAEINRAISLAVAPSTSYVAACYEFFAFCRQEDLGQPWPITVDCIQQYGVHLHQTGLASQSIQSKMLALAFYAKARDDQDPTKIFISKK